MRVMMLSWEYPPRIVGGISPHVYDLSRRLVERGIEVHVITKATPLAPSEEQEDSGVWVHRVALAEEPRGFLHEIELLNEATERRVRELLEDWRPGGAPTIFHAHDWLSLDAARTLKYEYKLPIVATLHATEWGRHGGIFSEISRQIAEREYWLTYEAWRLVVCSEFMRGEAGRLFNCPADKIEVVYNGVEPSRFAGTCDDAVRAKWAAPEEKIVLYVGRFVREKGIGVLLGSMSAVLAQEPNARFVVVGGGADAAKYEGFARWSGLSNRVTFAGFLQGEPLHELYRVADVAVFPSLYEPFGIVALEAMAAGVPVVASDAGGLKEIVVHDATGTSTYAGDASSLAWGIRRVLGDPARARRLASSASARLGVEFDWGRLADRTAALYDRVWNEFLASYWAERTVWPVSPGAEERYEEMRLRERLEAARVPERDLSRPAPKEREEGVELFDNLIRPGVI